MSEFHLEVLPVVHQADLHKLEGVVTLQDVFDAMASTALECEFSVSLRN
jgi:CBS domain-containing protein